MSARIVIVSGIDLSLTSTGIARITWEGGGHVDRTVERIQSTGHEGASLDERRIRLADVRRRVVDVVAASDLVVIEGPSMNSRYGHPHDRGGLWWQVVMCLAEDYGTAVAEVSPKTRAKYATGSGSAGKDAVLAATVKRYTDWDITGNDVADAVLLLAMGCRHIGRLVDKLPQLHVSAMAKVRWPELPVGLS